MLHPPIEISTLQCNPPISIPDDRFIYWKLMVTDERIPLDKRELITSQEPSGVFSPDMVAGLIKRAENYVQANKVKV